jgi:hypothetical protein
MIRKITLLTVILGMVQACSSVLEQRVDKLQIREHELQRREHELQRREYYVQEREYELQIREHNIKTFLSRMEKESLRKAPPTSEPVDKLPKFPWPPPQASAMEVIPYDLLLVKAGSSLIDPLILATN